MGVQFACEACGSPAVQLPDVFHESAEILCRRCRAVITTWGAFKERTKRIILEDLERRDAARSALASADRLAR